MTNYSKHIKGFANGTILMCHGNSSSSRVFDPLINSGKINQSIIAFDFFGHGRSPALPPDTRYSIENYRNQLLDVVNNIDDDIFLLGHSLGGHIAIEIAPFVKNLKGIFVFGTPPVKKPLNLGEAFNPVEIIGIMYTDSATDIQIDLLFDTFTHNKSFNNELISDYKSTDSRVRTDLANELQNPDTLQDELEIFRSLSCPKYILNAEYDPAINLDYLKNINEGNWFKLIEFAGSGHYPTLENSDEFIMLLKNAVDECM